MTDKQAHDALVHAIQSARNSESDVVIAASVAKHLRLVLAHKLVGENLTPTTWESYSCNGSSR